MSGKDWGVLMDKNQKQYFNSIVVLLLVAILLEVAILDISRDNPSNPAVIVDPSVPLSGGDVYDGFEFSTVEDMRQTDLEVGWIVSTAGYRYEDDNGGATYRIVQKSEYKTDNVYVIPIRGHLYAEMVFDEDTIVNVASAGIYPEENIGAKLNTLMYYSRGRVRGIEFNSGTYYIEKKIYLYDGLEVYGNGESVLSVAHDYSSSGTAVFVCSDTDMNLVFDSICFDYETDNTHPLSRCESVLMALTNISSCTINNCSFRAVNNTPEANIAIDLLWFMHTPKMNNISITDCVFENLTGVGSSPDTMLRGGSLWMSGPSGTTNYEFSDIEISNCIFNHTTNDEAIGIWSGKFKNVTLNNNTIESSEHNTNNIITFYRGQFTNVLFADNDLSSYSKANAVIKIGDISSDSTIDIVGNDLSLNADGGNPYSTTQSIILLIDDKANSTLVVQDNTISTDNDTEYRSLINCKNNTSNQIELSNNDITCPLVYGMIYINQSKDIDAEIRGNSIDNASYIAAASNCDGGELGIFDNTIVSSNEVLVKETNTLNCVVQNNDFDGQGNPSINYHSSAKNKSNVLFSESDNN